MEAKLKKITKFKKGDILCHHTNFELMRPEGITPIFFKATDEDVEGYSGKNGIYYKAIFDKEYTQEQLLSWMLFPLYKE